MILCKSFIFRVDLEFSTDYGRTWYLLHTPCLSGSCHGNHQPITSTYASLNIPRFVTEYLQAVVII